MRRRQFLQTAALPCWAACAAAAPDAAFTVEARHYEKLPSKQIKCLLCPRECVVDAGSRGHCQVRENQGGKYYSLIHSRICASNVDPIEKKPFFHVAPGSLAYSVATPGCNLHCKFCQNWEISQVRPEDVHAVRIAPNEFAGRARASRCASVAFTYSEPTVSNEFVVDTARALREAGGPMALVVSNGYIQRAPLLDVCRSVDAIKIDLKAFSDKFYREVTGASLKPVLETIVTIRKQGVWCEIVDLVIPTLNDADADFAGLARWVKAELGPDVPVHFTRFQPLYLLKNLPPTPAAALERAKAICDAEGLNYVYIGNIPGHPAENTRCPKCRRVIVERAGFTIRANHIEGGKCGFCKNPIPGKWRVPEAPKV
jgi:pyruvate formate lyase activating enzyme